jgi:hypothetical protein
MARGRGSYPEPGREPLRESEGMKRSLVSAPVRAVALALMLSSQFAAAANAQSAPQAASQTASKTSEAISVQLNDAETVNGSCRLTFVIRNTLPTPVDALGLDLVMFDTSDGVSGYAAIDFGDLPTGKTRVRQYDVAKGDCTGISRVLVNEVRACDLQDTAQQDCLPLLRIDSRSEIDLIL